METIVEMFLLWIFTGSASQKGTVMGILRSLGALARALGPVVCCSGKDRRCKILNHILYLLTWNSMVAYFLSC